MPTSQRLDHPPPHPVETTPAAERGGNTSSPETFPSGHQSRLAMPRDWRAAMGRRKSENSGSSASGSISKGLPQAQATTPLGGNVELHGAAGPAAAILPDKDPEQDSPAMSLLCSITKASANAVPEIRSPRFQARLRQRDNQRPRFASINSAGSSSGGTEGEFYRLPWYRRPLPSNRRTSLAGGEAELKRGRDKSMLGAPRTGSMTNMVLRQPRGSIGDAAAFTPISGSAVAVPAAAAPSAATAFGAENGASASWQQQQQQQEQQEHEKEQAPVHGGEDGVRVVKTKEPPTTTPVTVRPPPSVVPQVAAKDGFPPVMPAPAVAGVDSTPTANSMAADRDGSIPGESPGNPSKGGGVSPPEVEVAPADNGADADTDANADVHADGDGDANRDAGLSEIKRLRAEVNRLNRELASLAAAAVKDTITPPTERTQKDKAHRASPRIDVTSPVLSSTQTQHSKWEWDPKSLGSDESSEAGKVARPMSARLRADNSWMRRSSSDIGDGGGGHYNRRSSGNNWGGGGGGGRSTGNGSGFGDRARAGSVLPAPNSGGSRGRDRSPSGDGGDSGGQGLAAEERLLLSPPASGLDVEGPSPASGEKGEEAKAAVANERRRESSAAGSIEEEGEEGGTKGESARSSSSVRQMSVFFPVQQQLEVEVEVPHSAAQASAASNSAVTAEGAAALARAAATQIGATASPPEAARAAQAARDAFSARQQQQAVAARHAAAAAAAAPVVYAKIPVKPTGTGTGAGCRRRGGAGEGNRRVWRWVLAQRMSNQTVRQALMSHGLPSLTRRHIWAAWADVATPETYSRPRAMSRSDPPKEGSVVSIIAHDVTRTKMVHPVFETGGPGLGMLKRVLLRCAELGAVKEAGYIQGMNYLAGFVLITLADCILSEREDPPPPSTSTNNPSGGGGGESEGGGTHSSNSSRNGGSTTPAGPVPASTASSTVTINRHEETPPPQLETLPPAEDEEKGKGKGKGGKGDGDEHISGPGEGEGPTPAEIGLIESECVQVMQGVIALQGGVLSRDLWGLHANTELVEDLLTRHCPDVMDHLRMVNLELIVLTPRWFICIYAGSMASQAVVTRIWDLFLWHGRRGPAVVVWVALAILYGCRRRMFESKSLPATVKAVRRHAEGCKSFDELVRQAPISLDQVVAAWEAQGNNRKIAALDGEGVVPDRMAACLVGEMTGEPVYMPPQEALSPPHHHRRSASGMTPVATTPSAFGIQFPSTPTARPQTPLTSPRSPFPEWAANIFRSSTGGGGGGVENGEGGAPASAYVDRRGEGTSARGSGGECLPPMSPRFSTPSKTRQLRRAASTSWW